MNRYWMPFILILCFATSVFAQADDDDFRYSYARSGSTQTSVQPAETISFPDTAANITNPDQSSTNSVTFIITNRGTESGTVNNVTATGSAFRVSSGPLLPATIAPNQTLSFTLEFKPTQLGTNRGTLNVTLGSVVTFTLSGTGVGPSLTYDFTVGSTTRTVSANATLTMPETALGDRATATMRVRNTGNRDATISVIGSSSAVFSLENVPILPLTLPASSSITFNINFAPTQAGTNTALLRIGDVSFNLTGAGLGGTYTYSSVVGASTTTLTSNSTVIFAPAPIGSSSSARIQITNTGNTAGFINSISVTGPANGVFAISGLPALPLRVNGGATASFNVVFSPIALTQANGTLRIDNQTFSLSGVGENPPALPGVSFSSSGVTVDTARQISLGVALDTAYPVQLNGKLTLAFAPTADVFADDPAIAFASGGRTVNFVIPANSRNAIFGLSDSQIRLQTGTVAGTITMTATFTTEAGGINVTPTTAPASTITVRPTAPRITSVQLSNRTDSLVTVLVTGYSPTRSVNGMAFTFKPYVDPNNEDLKLATTSLNLAVDGQFGVWYQNAASHAFGSLFTAAVTFNIHGNVGAIQSVDVAISNSLGTSNSSSVTLR